MGLKSRTKGAALERQFAHAVGGKRVPLSGAVEGYPGDVKALGLVWEVKGRRGGFKLLYDFLKGKDALAVRQDRHEWLVVMPVDTFLNLLNGYDNDVT
jgi:hypothetical protein